LLRRALVRLALLVLALAACAHASPAVPERRAGGDAPEVRSAAPRPAAGPRPAEAAPDRAGSARQRLLAAARRHLGQTWRGDCSSFVERVHAEAGLPLRPLPARSASEGLWRVARPVERPRPGDLAFFHDTFDRDGDGRRDRFTHVALVEAVDGPRVTLVHRSSRGIQRLSMNLSRRHDPAENGYLRKRRAGDPPGRRFLSGELFAAYATAIPAGSARR
jgi:cell wall-associated NlpC family hydrolase